MKVEMTSTLIKDCLNGKEEAMTNLYTVSVSKIRLQLRKVGMQDADMEDVIQDTMIRVYAKLGQIKDPKCYAGWLFQVTKSIYNQHFKMKKKFICNEMCEDIIERRTYMLPSGYMENSENVRIIQQRMAGLKSAQQEVLILKYLKELSEEEISKKMNIPKGTVKSKLHYARLALQA